MPPFETVQKGSLSTSVPKITVYPSGGARLTKAADKLLDCPPAVELQVGTGPDAGLFSVVAADEAGPAAYAFTREGEAGGEISASNALAQAGVDFDRIEESRRLDVEDASQDGRPALLVDLAELPGVDSGHRHDADDADTEDSGDEQSESRPEVDIDDIETDDESDDPAEEDSGDDIDRPAEDVDAEPWTDTAKDRDERVQLLVEALSERFDAPIRTTITKLSGRLGEDVDGRGVVHSVRSLDGFDATIDGETDDGTSVWEITATDTSGEGGSSAGNETGDEDQDQDDSDSDDHHCWCGYCGQGPYQTAEDVEAHHDRKDHAGEPVVSATDPSEGDLVESEEGQDDAGDETGDDTNQATEIDLPDVDITVSAGLDVARTFGVHEVVDALAGAPSLQRLQGALGPGVDRDVARALLVELDLLKRFGAAAPLSQSEVRQTVAGYLSMEVDA